MTKMDWEKANSKRKRSHELPPKRISTWWWTVVRKSNRCSICSEQIPADTPYAYNHYWESTACQVCVSAQGLEPQKSKRYMRWEGRR